MYFNSYYNTSDTVYVFSDFVVHLFSENYTVVKRGHMQGARVDGCHVGESSHIQLKKLLYQN